MSERIEPLQLSRRAFVLGAAVGTAGLCRRPRTPPAAPPADALEALAERLRAASPDDAFGIAAAAIRGGAGPEALLGAVFLAGLRDIRPRPHGILHAVMMVESCFQLAAAAPAARAREAWLPVLWNLDDLKRSQERDRREDGDWSLPPRPRVPDLGAAAARAELEAAWDERDVERADRAVLALLPHHGRESLFELLWPRAGSCYAFIGHKLIYAAQIERVLARIGWRYAEPALRSLVMACLVNEDTGVWERTRELAPRLPAGWERGREEPAQSARLLAELRETPPARAQEVALAAFAEGLGPRTVWDALRLLGSEVFHRRPGRSSATGRNALLPVHALTVANACGHAWRATAIEETRRLIVLQAAGWLTALREDLVDMVDLSLEGPGIEQLGEELAAEEAPADLDELFEEGSPAAARALLDREPGLAADYAEGLRDRLCRRAREHHQHKYAAAALEEARLAHPRRPARVLAPAIDYLARPGDPETELYRRSLEALRAAGVR